VILGGEACYTKEMAPPAEGFASRFALGAALCAQPDRRLVTLVRSGYETAFEEIVRRYGRPLGRYAAAIVGNRAEDVTQDAFTKALLALRRDDAEIELRPWLYRIVRNTALNDLRDRPPTQEELTETLESGSHSAAEDAERREEVSELMKRLQALPEPQRAAIVMRELEGLSHEEIAVALGMSGGAARQAIYRARRALRDGLGLLLPLPLLKALLAGGAASAGAEVATGAAGVGSAAGAGLGIKAAAATVLVAGTVGTGVALDESRQNERSPEPTSPASPLRDRAAIPVAPVPSSTPSGSSSGPGGSGEKGSDDDRGHDSSGSGSGEDRDGHEEERERDDEGHGGRSGPSPSAGPGSDGGDRSGSSGSSRSGSNSGPGGGSGSSSGPGSGDEDSHGSGSSGSGSSSSGSGSGGDDAASIDDDDSSGSGSSGSGSGTPLPGEGSSGSGGDDD
jgi:RNA polymerase sigma factor (sigma-70 family)